MPTCITCASYYRITQFYNDSYNCQDCAYVLPVLDIEEECMIDIQMLVNPNGKTAAVFNEQDSNETDSGL